MGDSTTGGQAERLSCPGADLREFVARCEARVWESVGETIVSTKTLQDAALKLPLEQRAELAQKLLLSLDDPSEEELAETWLSEAERRAGELDRGEVQPIAAEEVRRKARSLLR